jgi:AraC-like DNA-binding protein
VTTDQPSTAFELVQREPIAAVNGIVSRLTGYRELVRGHSRQREAASLTIPLIISFGEPFAIGLGHAPTREDKISSFAAGLYAGPVLIDSFGASHCLQIDFTPLGARRFFRMPMSELADRMVPLDDVLGPSGLALREQLGDATDWAPRFELAERFVLNRIAGSAPASPEINLAFTRMAASGGRIAVSRLAAGVGWSRKHLAEKFQADLGLGPKSVARIIRLNRAMHEASRGDGWADIAAGCGFADQAHLTREFQDLAGLSPSAWQAGYIPSRPVELSLS